MVVACCRAKRATRAVTRLPITLDARNTVWRFEDRREQPDAGYRSSCGSRRPDPTAIHPNGGRSHFPGSHHRTRWSGPWMFVVAGKVPAASPTHCLLHGMRDFGRVRSLEPPRIGARTMTPPHADMASIPVTSTPTRLRSLAVLVAFATLASCSSGGDPAALATIEGVVPGVSAGELYVSTISDGSCRTDCPPPGVSRGWVIDCASIDDVRSNYIDRLHDAGFEGGGDEVFATTADSVEIDLTVSAYDDASVGPQPTEEPYASDPASLADRCSLFVLASARA